jgi:polyhydroxybutyrate depolymerase
MPGRSRFFSKEKRQEAMSVDERIEIEVGGQPRECLLHLPERSAVALPLVVMFHGMGGNAEWAAEETGWSQHADREGFAVVYPEGLTAKPAKSAKYLTNPPFWHDGSKGDSDRDGQQADLRFVAALLDSIIERFPVDGERVFATGFSNGGGMTFAVAAHMAERFAAIAPVAGHCWIERPRPSRPVPTIYMVGDVDPLIPLAGGRVRSPWGHVSHKPSVAETLMRWARAVDCGETPVTLSTEDGVRHDSFPAHDGQDRFLALTIAGLGHHWPGGAGKFLERLSGPRHSPINACEQIWGFFKRWHI